MKEIYIIKWLATGQVAGTYAYTDYGEAMRDAEERNKKRKWHHRIYTTTLFVVQTLQVKAGG